MFRTIIALMAALGLIVIVTMPAQAENVNIHTPVTITQGSTSFEVDAFVTGLAGGNCFLGQFTGTVSGTVQCSNPGQPHQPKPKKFSEPTTATVSGIAPGNGNINTLDITVTPQTPSASICTNGNTSGWTVTLLSYSATGTLTVCDAGPVNSDGTCTASCLLAAGDAGSDSVSISVP